MYLLWRDSSKGETRATRGSDLTLQLKCRLSFFFASDYTLSGAKASTTSVTCISNSRNTPSFSNRLSSLLNCLREAEMRGWEAEEGIEGKRAQSRLQSWTTARLCFRQCEASRHKEGFVAAVKIRDAQRLENMSDVKESTEALGGSFRRRRWKTLLLQISPFLYFIVLFLFDLMLFMGANRSR